MIIIYEEVRRSRENSKIMETGKLTGLHELPVEMVKTSVGYLVGIFE